MIVYMQQHGHFKENLIYTWMHGKAEKQYNCIFWNVLETDMKWLTTFQIVDQVSFNRYSEIYNASHVYIYIYIYNLSA